MKPYYQDDSCTIYHADCREVLPLLEPVDLVLTDPPYGIGEAAGKNKSRGDLAVAKDYGSADWDNAPIAPDLIALCVASGRHAAVFGGNYYELPASGCWFVWDKDNSENDFADCEMAWTNLPGAVRRIVWRWNGMLKKLPEQRFHPTQKPVYVMQWAVLQADKKTGREVAAILDPFMGSGTTLVAAKNLNRKAIGIELEEKYCEIAAKRLRQGVLALSC